MNSGSNGLNLSNLIYKDKVEDNQHSFTIRASNSEREDTFKLGKSLFILLNDTSSGKQRENDSAGSGKVKEINSVSTKSLDSNGSVDTDLLFSGNSDLKKALNSIDRSIEINPLDSINSIVDSMVSSFNEIQINDSWKLDLAMVISNIYNSGRRESSSVLAIQKLPTPQRYFKIFRLFSYILNNYSGVFYKSIYYRLTDKVVDDTSDNSNNNPSNDNSNNSSNSDYSDNSNNNPSNDNSNNSSSNDNSNNNSNNDNSTNSHNEISDKRKVKDQFSKDEKKQILDLFNFIQQFYILYSFNNIKTARLNYKELSLIINQIIPAITNSILNKCSIINEKTQLISPTRLTTQSSDILVSLVIIVVINLQQKEGEEDNQVNQLLKSLNGSLIEYFNEIKKWYHNKPLFIFIVDLVNKTLSNGHSSTLENLVFIYQIIPLFYYQYPLSTKIALLNTNIDSLLKYSSQSQPSTNNQAQIQRYSIIVLQLLSSLSEKPFNNFIQQNHTLFTNIILFLINIKVDSGSILKQCSSKFLEIVYKINLNSDIGSSDDNYCIELIKKENLVENPALLDFIIVLVKDSSQLVKSLISILNNSNNSNKDNSSIVVINNIVVVLDRLYKEAPNSLPVSVKEDTLNSLLPVPPTIPSSSSHFISYECLSILLNNFEPSIILPRLLQYIFTSDTEISTHYLEVFCKWVSDLIPEEILPTTAATSSISTPSISTPSLLDFKFEILLEIILDNYSKLPSSNSKSCSNPSELYCDDEDNEEQVNESNSNIYNYNYEVLLDRIIPSLGKKLSQVKDSELRFSYWKIIISILEIKSFSNPKNSIISKILPKLIKFMDKQFIISIVISSVNEKLKSQNSLLSSLNEITLESTSAPTSNSNEEVFKFLSPLLILTVSIKEVVDEMNQFSKQSTENDILMAELVDNLIKRINSKSLLLEIRRLASDCCSYTPPSYWSNSMSSSLSKQYQTYSNIQDNGGSDSSELVKSSLQIIKLILFCFCNGYLVHGSNDVDDVGSSSGIAFKNSKELLSLFDSILFKYSDASKELINGSPDSEIGKLFMAVGDCVSFMIKSSIKRGSLTIASNSTVSLNIEKLKSQPSINLLGKIGSMDDLLPTIFRIILFTNSIQKQSRSISTTATVPTTNIDYYYSKRSKIVLLNSLITLIKLLDSNENEYLTKQITLLLVKINYTDSNSNIVDLRLKVGSIQVLFNLYYKLDEDSTSLKLYSESLLDLIKEILDISSTSPPYKLASLRLLGVLMKYPKSIFSNQSSLKEITYILTLSSTDNDKEIKSLSLNLLSLLKSKS